MRLKQYVSDFESPEVSSRIAVIKNSLASTPEWDHIEYKAT